MDFNLDQSVKELHDKATEFLQELVLPAGPVYQEQRDEVAHGVLPRSWRR